jgi:uroporphyrinogen decarboxylase
MAFEPVDRTLLWEAGYWADSVRRWHREGLCLRYPMPDSVAGATSIQGYVNFGRVFGTDTAGPVDDASQAFACAQDIHDHFALDQAMVHVPVRHWLTPGFEPQILEDHGDWVIWRDDQGITKRDRKDRKSLPHWIGWPVNNRDEWEQIKAERLRPTLEDRLPDDWAQHLEAYRSRDYPICIGGFPAGFYGGTRQLVGQDRILTLFHDDPGFIHDIMDYLGDFLVSIYDQVLDQVDADVCFVWEDMCYKNGPLISPAMFREFMLPNYKKLTACLRDHGVTSIMVDTDGDARQLIPLFIEGGATIMYSLEPEAGMDVVELRKTFPRLGLMGGMSKRVLAHGRDAIDAELEYKIPFMLPRGGFIPFCDHQVPPDVSWEDFRHYRERLNAMILDHAPNGPTV